MREGSKPRKRNPYLELGKSRRYFSSRVGFESYRAFRFLIGRIGKSAATTYLSQRRWGGMSVGSALRKAREQVQVLGLEYPGGMECAGFRRHE